MYRNTILAMDAVIAVSLVDLSMQDCTLNDTVDALHSTFQKYPDFDYLCTAQKLLTRLNLYEIWHNELLYYAKLLQVDHKTLESDIERGLTRLFAKYDDVTDDNILLSSTLVTSSYFNDKRLKNNDVECLSDGNHSEDKNDHRTVVNKKLAATLKKHAALNKADKNPNMIIKKLDNRRKRKQTSIDTSTLKSKINKHKIQNSSDMSSGEENVESRMLNAVPSVNDVFHDLDFDLNFGDKRKNKKRKSASKGHKKLKHTIDLENNVTEIEKLNVQYHKNTENDVSNTILEIQTDNKNKDVLQVFPEENHVQSISSDIGAQTMDTDINNESINEKPNLKTMDKLKQFQFIEKHDLSKYEEKISKPKENNDVVKLQDIKIEKSLINQNKSSSSQISIFESGDCNIDLYI